MDDLKLARNNLHSAISESLAQAAGHPGRWQQEDQANAELIVAAIDRYIDAKIAAE